MKVHVVNKLNVGLYHNEADVLSGVSVAALYTLQATSAFTLDHKSDTVDKLLLFAVPCYRFHGGLKNVQLELFVL